jgi:hypothetical protein
LYRLRRDRSRRRQHKLPYRVIGTVSYVQGAGAPNNAGGRLKTGIGSFAVHEPMGAEAPGDYLRSRTVRFNAANAMILGIRDVNNPL